MIFVILIYKIFIFAIPRRFYQAMCVIKTVATPGFFLKQPAIMIISDDQKFKSALSRVNILTSDVYDKYGYIKISGIHSYKNIQHDTAVEKLINTAIVNPESAG